MDIMREDREEATRKILNAKKEKGYSFEKIAEKVGRNKVWVASAMMGQNTMNEQEATTLCQVLDLDSKVQSALQEPPMRGAGYNQSLPPPDPTIYRFYEAINVYGPTLKALLHEEFGDGIMSAIDFKMDMERKEDPNGDRVKITLDGKFLPYKKW